MLWNSECRHGGERSQSLWWNDHPSTWRNMTCVPAGLQGFPLCAKSRAGAFSAHELCTKRGKGYTGPFLVAFLPLLSSLLYIHKHPSWPVLAILSVLFISSQPPKCSDTLNWNNFTLKLERSSVRKSYFGKGYQQFLLLCVRLCVRVWTEGRNNL